MNVDPRTNLAEPNGFAVGTAVFSKENAELVLEFVGIEGEALPKLLPVELDANILPPGTDTALALAKPLVPVTDAKPLVDGNGPEVDAPNTADCLPSPVDCPKARPLLPAVAQGEGRTPGKAELPKEGAPVVPNTGVGPAVAELELNVFEPKALPPPWATVEAGVPHTDC